MKKKKVKTKQQIYSNKSYEKVYASEENKDIQFQRKSSLEEYDEYGEPWETPFGKHVVIGLIALFFLMVITALIMRIYSPCF